MSPHVEDCPVALVVDDDEAARLMTRIALEQAGFRVLEADDGVPALVILRSQQVDIVLLDVMMRTLDGFATCAALRALPDGDRIPVMMMTGLEDAASIEWAYEAGATDFEIKPLNFDVLVHRVRYLLRSARTANALRASETRLGQAQRLARLGHYDWNPRTGVLLCSPVAEEILGLASGAVVVDLAELLAGADPDDGPPARSLLADCFSRGGEFRSSHRLLLADRQPIHVQIEGASGHDEGTSEAILSGVIQDVSERQRLEGLAHQLTYFDPVTGLPNRATLGMELAQTLATEQGALAVLSLDIANFSRLNDSFGREQGDQVLRTVAERIGQCVRRGERASYPARESRVSKDLLARTGGDEFYALLNGLRAPEDAAVVARRILDAIAMPLMIGTQEVVLSATVGISVFPMDGTSAENLIEHADAARRHAKAAGRGGFHFYTSGINHLAANRVSMENALRRALQLGQFELYYQPKLRLADRQMLGVEALIRWHHPVLGLVSPGEFIPLAEETGLIVPLGRWIVHQACADLAAWQKQGLAALSCAINVSPIQFETDGLLDLLQETVAAYGIAPERLEIELTESALIHDTARSIGLLNEFRGQGFAVWVDDFGTGYSSLSYLRQFPVTGLKIDQSFIRDMTFNDSDAAIVAAVIALSRSLNLEVVAEGIETVEQTAFLEPLGCDYGQGFLYGRPMPAASITRMALEK